MKKSYLPTFITESRAILPQIILGNFPTGKDYWTGNFFGLAIYDHSLSNEQVLQYFQGC
ncbi:MAG: hypothetical protein ABSG71_19855 [Thermodesulfobacteriota bacterium]